MKRELSRVILKKATVFISSDYNIEVQIARMCGKYAYGIIYQNGHSSHYNLLGSVPEFFFYNTEKEAVAKVIQCLKSKTEFCLLESTIKCNRCRHTQQMHDAIIEQLKPKQLELFATEGVW